LIEVLQTPVDAEVAAVVAGVGAIPPDGGFGTSSVMSYEVVATFDSVPLASEVYPTVVVSWDQMVDVARRRHEAQRPSDVGPEEWAETFEPPIVRPNQRIVSQLDEQTLAEYLDADDVQVGEFTTIADRERLVSARAAQWTFGYLGLLAVVAGLAAIGTMLFYLSEQRTARRLSSVMSRRMGMRPVADAAAEVLELLGLVMIAYVAGTSTALLLANRVFDRFEPDQRVPPDVGLEVSWPLLLTLATLGIGAVVVAALANHRLAARQSYGEVLRGI
jgi:hypothetical protein